jgi:hypothetical protein
MLRLSKYQQKSLSLSSFLFMSSARAHSQSSHRVTSCYIIIVAPQRQPPHTPRLASNDDRERHGHILLKICAAARILHAPYRIVLD